MQQLKMAYIIPLVLFTKEIIPQKLQRNLKFHDLRPAPYSLMQKAAVRNTCCVFINFRQNSE